MTEPNKKGGGKSGGGFSIYCIACAISVESVKVLNLEIACNGCRFCVEKQQALREYKIWKEMHESSCQAKVYGAYSSVAL